MIRRVDASRVGYVSAQDLFESDEVAVVLLQIEWYRGYLICSSQCKFSLR